MTNLEKYRNEFVDAMDHMRNRECSELLKISGLKCEHFKHCNECCFG